MLPPNRDMSFIPKSWIDTTNANLTGGHQKGSTALPVDPHIHAGAQQPKSHVMQSQTMDGGGGFGLANLLGAQQPKPPVVESQTMDGGSGFGIPNLMGAQQPKLPILGSQTSKGIGSLGFTNGEVPASKFLNVSPPAPTPFINRFSSLLTH